MLPCVSAATPSAALVPVAFSTGSGIKATTLPFLQIPTGIRCFQRVPLRFRSRPLANLFHLGGRNMQEFQQLLVFRRRGLFKFTLPAVHLLLGEARCSHNLDPLLLRNHSMPP